MINIKSKGLLNLCDWGFFRMKDKEYFKILVEVLGNKPFFVRLHLIDFNKDCWGTKLKQEEKLNCFELTQHHM